MLGVGRLGPRSTREEPGLRPEVGTVVAAPTGPEVGVGPAAWATLPGDGSDAPGDGRRGTTGEGAWAGGHESDAAAERLATERLAAERRAWVVLASVGSLGPATAATLVRVLGSARAVVDVAAGAAGARDLAALVAPPDAPRPGEPILEASVAAAIAEVARSAASHLDAVERAGLDVLVIDDPRYPARLRAIELPPPVLFVRGDPAALEADRCVAVVGTRRPTDAGRRFAAALAGALVRCDAVVVSGLAVGIDGAAHAAAIAENGRTVAVLGGGHNRLYPRSHGALAEAIVASGGALISELPPGTGPTRWQFPRRNRIVSGLAEATVVVEAAPGSGALVTAGWALEQGRECFLVPGPVGARTSAGCLAFLREHHGIARIVAGIPELLDDLGYGRPRRRSGRPSRAAILATLGTVERAVAEVVAEGAVSVDGIVAATGLPVASVLGAISLLEARDLVGSGYGRYWPIGRLASAAER